MSTSMVDRAVVLFGRSEERRRARSRPASPQDAAPTRVAGVGVTVQRRISRQRKERRQPGSQPIADLDGGRAVGYLHVHMTSADPLLVRDHSELRTDPPVLLGAADRELVRRTGVSLGPGLDPAASAASTALRRSGVSSWPSSALVAATLEVVSPTTAQFQLQVHARGARPRGHRRVMRGRFAGPRVNEEELLLHTDSGKVPTRASGRAARNFIIVIRCAASRQDSRRYVRSAP